MAETCCASGIDFEIVIVDDGSSDNSWSIIEHLARAHKEIKGIKLAKNYGQHTANLCGFEHASKQNIITMDDDLQNPPSEIIKLLTELYKGYDLVFGEFRVKKHGWIRRLGSRVISSIVRNIFSVSDEISLSNYRAFTKQVADRVIEEASVRPYIPGLILKNSGTVSTVIVEHAARQFGRSGYNFEKLMKVVIDLLFQHSNIPLRIVSLLGFGVSIIAFSLGAALILDNLILGNVSDAPGWASLVVLISFLGGINIFSIGVIGEYVIRILRQVSEPNIYVASKVLE